MDFGMALWNLKNGNKVARKGWNGKGMFLFLERNPILNKPMYDVMNCDVLPTIVMKTATNELCVGWLASQTDMLAEDWEVVE